MVFHNGTTRWLMPIVLVMALLTLSACKNNYSEQIDNEYAQVERNLQHLERQLQTKQLSNIRIVDLYAQRLSQLNRDFKPVANAMAKDATAQGTLYTGLVYRLHNVNRQPENKQQFESAHQSLMAIDIAADPVVFNDALIDLINTMADLSGGQLATMSIPKNTATSRREAITPGSYLVGNPNYGEYHQDHSGHSIWHWYGQYAFFSSLARGSLFNPSPIYYNDWNSRAHYSYYNDYGRNTYGSYNDRRNTTQRNTRMRNQGYTPAKPKKQYGSVQGRQRLSSYSQKQATQASHLNKKYGSSNNGARHADKTITQTKSSYFGSKKTSTSTRPIKRSSSFLGSSSARNISRRSLGSRSFGGK